MIFVPFSWFCAAVKRAKSEESVTRATFTMKSETATTLQAFGLELIVYTILVTGYFFLVLHYLSGWLQELHLHHVKLYALVAILLIIGQAVLLESVTTSLLRFLRGRSE